MPAVRLPLAAGGGADLERERRWLPLLGPLLPLTIPHVVAHGVPAEGYPREWSVHRWIEGRNPVQGRLARPAALAADLASFVRRMRAAYYRGTNAAMAANARHVLAQILG